MEQHANNASLVAVDLGAQSCRVSLLQWNGSTPSIEVVHRFPNSPVQTDRGLRWNLQTIVEGVHSGLRECARRSPDGIRSIAVDGWAVDYVRLGEDGKAVEDPFCYRDARTEQAFHEVHKRISRDHLYELTGIQQIPLNTLYQHYADKLAGKDTRKKWLNLPEYITHLLGGDMVSEFTNATHTQLVGIESKDWCSEIFDATGLDRAAAPKLVPTGSIVGKLSGELQKLSAFRNTELIVPACHDTASAIAAIPATGEDWAFISSGTWSLVGTVCNSPCVSAEARAMNFTNLGGVGGKVCFLKNVNGMWLLSQCMEEWERAGHKVNMQDLLMQCEALPAPQQLIPVDEPELMQPGGMLAKINSLLVRTGATPFSGAEENIPAVANLIFHSLAKRYAEVLSAVSKTTGKSLKRLFIVGGGSKNHFLNRLTAASTGLEVVAGPSECTTIGNFAIQLAALNQRGEVSAEIVAKYAKDLEKCL